MDGEFDFGERVDTDDVDVPAPSEGAREREGSRELHAFVEQQVAAIMIGPTRHSPSLQELNVVGNHDTRSHARAPPATAVQHSDGLKRHSRSITQRHPTAPRDS